MRADSGLQTVRAAVARTVPVAFCAALLAILSACGPTQEKPAFHSTDVTGADWGQDFDLFDVDGRERRLADYRGRAVMLYMGYTHCPDACPTTLARMSDAIGKLGSDARNIQAIFVTLDPMRDSAAVLRQYVRAFNPAFVALRGSTEATASTAKDFKVSYEVHKPDANGSYSVDHASGIFVFDPKGRLRLYMGANLPLAPMVHDLRLLLRNGDEGRQ